MDKRSNLIDKRSTVKINSLGFVLSRYNMNCLLISLSWKCYEKS